MGSPEYKVESDKKLAEIRSAEESERERKLTAADIVREIDSVGDEFGGHEDIARRCRKNAELLREFDTISRVFGRDHECGGDKEKAARYAGLMDWYTVGGYARQELCPELCAQQEDLRAKQFTDYIEKRKQEEKAKEKAEAEKAEDQAARQRILNATLD